MAGPGFIAGSRVTKGSMLAEVSVRFNCGVQYISHEPATEGDNLRVRIESTGICNGVSPSVSSIREQYRPANADDANLVSVEYDGESGADAVLRLTFDENVRYFVRPNGDDNSIVVRVFLNSDEQSAGVAENSRTSKRIVSEEQSSAAYVINLASSRRPPGAADLPGSEAPAGKEFFYTEVTIDGVLWHRLRLGFFETAQDASQALVRVRNEYPSAWIDRGRDDASNVILRESAAPSAVAVARSNTQEEPAISGTADSARIDELMREARRAMTAGEISRAIQIYTKVLQLAPNAHELDAQEFLGLARERNGQLAHAKAEYQRYLALYPDSPGAGRVQQRLSSLLAQGSPPPVAQASTQSPSSETAGRFDDWNIRTFFSQFYRRDVNQVNDNDEVISQSSLYSDLNIDARRRGERFDFSTRLTAGYRNDFLEESTSSGNDLRVSYAYADLADSHSGLRGRVGRQSRSTGGVLGRFDGFNLSYQLSERISLDAVAGKPVYSTSNGVDESRTFYGVSANSGLFVDDLNVGVFFLQQDASGLTDRQVIGGEARYFSDTKSLWGLIDYDIAFQELGSVFLQGSWRLPNWFTVTGMLDRRRSPFLSTSNALIGQFDTTFDELASTMSEEELRQLALDRAASTTTVTIGLSRALTPKLRINLNASQATIDATPSSGGVLGTEKSTYVYVSSDLVASSLFTQGDVSIFSIRYADSNTTEVLSARLDTRFPIGRSFRINPRIRADLRQIKSDLSEEIIITPGLRIQYRWGKRLRLDLEAGRKFANRELADEDLKRESYFVNFGYQFFY